MQKLYNNLQFKYRKEEKNFEVIKKFLPENILKNPAPPRFFILLDFLTKNRSFSD
jgi:hypothetical protein